MIHGRESRAKMSQADRTWKDVVAEALSSLGGEAHLSEINDVVQHDPRTATNPTWRDTIRRVVRQYKVFEPVPPHRSGRYRLVETAVVQPVQQSIDSRDADINHGTAQGMIVNLGRIYGYETYVPPADQTMREFSGSKLGELVTVKDCTGLVPGPNLPKIKQIDVLWFAEDDHGLYPVYGFEVEHTTRVKNGMDRLLKIPERFNAHLFVLGPTDAERDLFDGLLIQTPFRKYRDRFAFRLYSELENLHNTAVSHREARDAFGLTERD